MYRKQSRTNQYQDSKQGIIRKKSTQKKSTMGKYFLTKRRHSHQSNLLPRKQETTLICNSIEHANSTTRLKHRTNTSFRPLAASTPYEIEQSNPFNHGSPHSIIRSQRVFLTSPVCCSTPKQTRRPISNNNSHGRTSPTYKQRCCLDPHPPMPIISQRRLQFTPNSESFVHYANDETKRIHLPNIKIWLL